MRHPEQNRTEKYLLIERPANWDARARPSSDTAQNPNESGLFHSRRPTIRLFITCR